MKFVEEATMTWRDSAHAGDTPLVLLMAVARPVKKVIRSVRSGSWAKSACTSLLRHQQFACQQQHTRRPGVMSSYCGALCLRLILASEDLARSPRPVGARSGQLQRLAALSGARLSG